MRHGVRIHAVKDGRELITLGKDAVESSGAIGGGVPAMFTLDGRELFCRRNASVMSICKTADWTLPARETEFNQGLDNVRRMLGLSAN